MDMGNVLSVGYEFDYPLKGGESLYDLLSTFNAKFSLNLTKDNYDDTKAVRNKANGLIEIIAVSRDLNTIYNFVNTTNHGIESIEDISVSPKIPIVITGRPLNFKEEIAFLADVPLNTSIDYSYTNSKIIAALQRRLTHYDFGDWRIMSSEGNCVSGFILRYYGSGDQVPSEYGVYSADITVAIIDLEKEGYYVTHCLRTKEYHVYDNGYRSGD